MLSKECFPAIIGADTAENGPEYIFVKRNVGRLCYNNRDMAA